MKIRTGTWHHWLYTEFGSKPKGQPNLCAYVRRVVFNAFICILLAIVAIAFATIFAVFTVAANCVTIPLGFGVAVTWPDKDFMQIPFRVQWRGERKSLACFLVPFWLLSVVATCLWWGFSNNPTETMELLIAVGTFVGWVAVAILGLMALVLLIASFLELKKKLADSEVTGPVADAYRMAKAYVKARKEGICPLVEFVEPSEPSPPSS